MNYLIAAIRAAQVIQTTTRFMAELTNVAFEDIS